MTDDELREWAQAAKEAIQRAVHAFAQLDTATLAAFQRVTEELASELRRVFDETEDVRDR